MTKIVPSRISTEFRFLLDLEIHPFSFVLNFFTDKAGFVLNFSLILSKNEPRVLKKLFL